MRMQTCQVWRKPSTVHHQAPGTGRVVIERINVYSERLEAVIAAECASTVLSKGCGYLCTRVFSV